MYCFELKNELTNNELMEYFNILKPHLILLYGEENANNGFSGWYESRSKFSPQKYFIKMLKNEEVLGYAELMIRQDNTLYFCDIILKEEVRRTSLVFEFIKFVLNCEPFEKFDEIYMHINRNNYMSLKTWSHFNYEKLEEQNLSNFYKINRTEIVKFVNKLDRKNKED